jgi:hypothetical protein
MTHAQWPKDASAQAGGAACQPSKTMDIKSHPIRSAGFKQRAKKL